MNSPPILHSATKAKSSSISARYSSRALRSDGSSRPAMTAGIGRPGVDRAVEYFEHRAEQIALRVDQPLIVECHRGLAGERLDQRHGFRRERNGTPIIRRARINQLHYANHFGLVVLQRDGQEGLRAVTGPRVERARDAKVKARGIVGIIKVDRVSGNRCGRNDARVARGSVWLAQRHRGKRDRRPGGAAERELHRVVAHDRKAQLAAVLADEIQRPAISIRQLFSAEQDHLQQAVVITLRRQRDTKLDQPTVRDFPLLDERTCARPVPFYNFAHISFSFNYFFLFRRHSLEAVPSQLLLQQGHVHIAIGIPFGIGCRNSQTSSTRPIDLAWSAFKIAGPAVPSSASKTSAPAFVRVLIIVLAISMSLRSRLTASSMRRRVCRPSNSQSYS